MDTVRGSATQRLLRAVVLGQFSLSMSGDKMASGDFELCLHKPWPSASHSGVSDPLALRGQHRDSKLPQVSGRACPAVLQLTVLVEMCCSAEEVVNAVGR